MAKDFDRGEDTGVYMGADPDTHNNAIAYVGWVASEQRFRILAGALLKVPGGPKGYKGYAAVQAMFLLNLKMLHVNQISAPGVEGAAVEGQIIIPRSPQRPQDIMHLGMVAQQTAMALTPLLRCPERLIHVVPLKWKGSIPKIQHQSRMCKNLLKLPFERRSEYVIPTADYEIPMRIWTLKPGEIQEKATTADKIGAGWKHFLDAVGLAIFARTKIIT